MKPLQNEFVKAVKEPNMKMSSAAVVVFVLLAAGCAEDVPQFTVVSDIDCAEHEGACQLMQADTAKLNDLLGCEVVSFSAEKANFWWRWVSWAEYNQKFPSGVSTMQNHTAWVAYTGLPPELDEQGELSDCDAERLFLHWVGQQAGITTTHNKNLVSFNHPNCAPQLDLVGQLAEAITLLHPRICEGPVLSESHVESVHTAALTRDG